jgi:hypothetical protein
MIQKPVTVQVTAWGRALRIVIITQIIYKFRQIPSNYEAPYNIL